VLAIALILDAEISWFSTCYETADQQSQQEKAIEDCGRARAFRRPPLPTSSCCAA
jgi:hypothetical protein